MSLQPALRASEAPLVESGTLALLVIIAASEAVALLCAMRLWRSREPALRCFTWTFVLLVPILGPLLFGAQFPATRSKPDVPGNPDFNLTRFDPTNASPPER
jgi:hypothetical protein